MWLLATNVHRTAWRSAVRLGVVGLVAGAAVVLASVGRAHAADTVLVLPGGVDPPVLHTMMGTRVAFENRTGRAVHLEFEGDGRLHEVVQRPATGPFWVVFHRPGIHRYVVHVYETTERTLPGAVDVAADAARPTPPAGCAVAVMGLCVEP